MKTTKKLLAIILGLAMLLSMGVSASTGVEAAADGNLLTNPSFENGWEGWFARARQVVPGEVPDWTTTNHDHPDGIYDLTSNEDTEKAGIYAYDEPMTVDDGFGGNYISFVKKCGDSILVQEVSGLKPGGRYEFSGWAYVASGAPNEDVRTNAYIVYAYNDKNGNRLAQTAYGDETKDGSQYAYGMHGAISLWSSLKVDDWAKITATIELPEEAYGMAVGIITTGWQYVRSYDNFSLIDKSNLLEDGGFENVTFPEGSKLGDAPTWVEPTGDAITERYTEDAHSGDYAYKVNITGATTVGSNSQCVAVTAGEVYKLSFWRKVYPTVDAEENAKDWFLRTSLTLAFSNQVLTDPIKWAGDWSKIATVTMSTAKQSSADGWLQTVAYFKAPSNAKGLQLSLSTNGVDSTGSNRCGYIAFDDVELTNVRRTEEVFSIFSDAARTGKKTGDESFTSKESYAADGNTKANDEADDTAWATEWTAIQPYYVQKTVKTEAAVKHGETYYAAAMTRNADTALLFALYEEGENGVRTLREIRMVDAPNSTAPMGILHTDTEVASDTSETGVAVEGGITVPADGGTYTLEAYLWDGVGSIKPLKEKTVLR